MEPVKNITPIQAADLTREHFRWKEHVQHQLDQYVPIYCEKGERSGRVCIKVTVDITPAEASRIVNHILDDLGWKPTDPEYSPINHEISFVVSW